MSRIRKASVLADARNSPVSAERLPTNPAAIRTTVEPQAVVYPFPAPPAVPFEEPLRVARAITRISTALERVGFRVGGEKQTAEVLASARDARSEMIDVRFYPCGAELGSRTWSGKASALLEIFHGMTDGTDSDERVAVIFTLFSAASCPGMARCLPSKAPTKRAACRWRWADCLWPLSPIPNRFIELTDGDAEPVLHNRRAIGRPLAYSRPCGRT